MTSKQRVLDAINHKQPDKLPIDFGGNICTTMHVSCVIELRKYYGLDEKLVKIADASAMTGVIDPDLQDAIGTDVEEFSGLYSSFGLKNQDYKEWDYFGTPILVPGDFTVTKDEKGGYKIYPCGDLDAPASGHLPYNGHYFDAIIRQEPYDDDYEFKVEDNLEDFQPIDDETLAFMRKKAEQLKNSNRATCAYFGGTSLGCIADIPGIHLKHPKGIRNIEEWYMTPIIRPEFMKELFDRQTDICVENFKKIYDAIGDTLDVLFLCGTDDGTQISTFCDPDTYYELHVPYYQKMTKWIHENTNWKIFKHSCGAVFDLIPHYIESGFDILNPVQCSATGMDPQKLKDTYGKDITFWGGGIDTQHLLPFGTPEEIRKQVLERCEIFSKGGGYVFNSIHVVQHGTPVENIVAMIDAVHEFNGDK